MYFKSVSVKTNICEQLPKSLMPSTVTVSYFNVCVFFCIGVPQLLVYSLNSYEFTQNG